ncbi:MAG: SDR family oxidoreductase [Anaerolinea sp.]|nr:SDR family oxidoreductase [Anaerolinea sp.]
MQDLSGKIAIVTGGGQGLGEATARALAAAGVTVVCADVQEAKAFAVADALRADGCSAEGMRLDVTDENSVHTVVDGVRRSYGKIDILINNAGTDVTKPFHEMTVAEWERVLNVNLRGAFLLARYVIPHMYERRSGQIVNVASTASKRMWTNASAYHASKWGLIGFSHALFTEARQFGVKVSAIVAGGMQTPFILDRFPDTPLDKLQDPANVAQTILFILRQPQETIIPEVMVVPLNESSWP